MDAMRISEVLRKKGAAVVTIGPQATISELLGVLAEHNVGAVVVSGDGLALDGIVSERDVVRRLHRVGAPLLDRPVSDIMTAVVHTCAPDDRVDYFYRLLGGIYGWASFLRRSTWQGSDPGTLVDLLAIRACCDSAVARANAQPR